MTVAQAASLGLTEDEYERIVDTLRREPTAAELAMYAAMWSEHCSYKSSRMHLRRLPTEAPWVLVGPGEGAGVVDVADARCTVPDEVRLAAEETHRPRGIAFVVGSGELDDADVHHGTRISVIAGTPPTPKGRSRARPAGP